MIRGFFLAVLALFAAQPAMANEEDFEAFGAFLEQFRKESNTPAMSALIVKDGAIAWESYLGWSDDEGDIPTSPQTTYYIASVTKPIAATAIHAESLAGGVDLATPMASDAGWTDLCQRMVQTPIPFMSGGEDLFGNAIAPMDCDKATSLGNMLDMRANGGAFVYNPIAYARIDRAIEGAGGRPLRDIVRERVLEPAGMQDVALGWRDPSSGAALRYLTMPHHVIDGRIKKQPYPDDDFRAAAGMVANPRALAAFDIAYDQGRLVPPEHRARLAERQVIGPLGDYRLGWWREDYKGKRLMWHSGKDDRKYSAIYLKVPEQRLTLIVLANSEAIWNEGSSLVLARASLSPVARRFLEEFVD